MKRGPVRRLELARERAPVRVRSARRADRAAVTALWSEADRLHSALHPGYFRGDGRLDPRLEAAFDRLSDGRELLVADRGAKVIGFVLVELLEPARLGRVVTGRRGHIDTLVVAVEARRTGCGRQLVEAAVAWARARRAEELLLTVWSGNEAAERFYERLGLSAVSRVMRLPL